MIIKIEANDFCPDNCPFFEGRSTTTYTFERSINGEHYTKLWHCEHSTLCAFAVSRYKETQEVEND